MFICVLTSYAQEQKGDLIIKSDGTKIEAKVLYIESDVVKYKRFDNLDGPTYSVNQDDIATILYANGTVDVFQKKTPSEKFYPMARQSEIKTCDELQADFERASRLKQKGVGLLVPGLMIFVAGTSAFAIGCCSLHYDWAAVVLMGSYISMAIGISLIIPGAIVTGIGNGKLRRISDEMNEICSVQLNKGGKYPVYLSFATNGLALRF